jgi:hypothetical protein
MFVAAGIETVPALSQATILSMMVAAGSGLALYGQKQRGVLLDREIARDFDATTAARDQTSLLRAEWASLNAPDRLAAMARHYLALRPIAPAQFAQASDLATRLPAPGAQPVPAVPPAPAMVAAAAAAGPPGADTAESEPPLLRRQAAARPAPRPPAHGATRPSVMPPTALARLEPLREWARPHPAHPMVLARSEPPHNLALPPDYAAAPARSDPPHVLTLPQHSAPAPAATLPEGAREMNAVAQPQPQPQPEAPALVTARPNYRLAAPYVAPYRTVHGGQYPSAYGGYYAPYRQPYPAPYNAYAGGYGAAPGGRAYLPPPTPLPPGEQ